MKKIENLPRDLCFPPGVIGDVSRYVLARSHLKNFEFGLSAGLALASVCVGRKVVDAMGTRPNLYVLNIGDTGAGKESPRKTLKDILHPTDLLCSETFTSDSAFVRELMEKPSMLCISDEIGDQIELLNDGRASTHVKALATAMVQAYTQSSSVWDYRGYADSTNSKTIDQPNFVLHGSGNGDTFFRALKPEKVASGFLGRFLLFLSENAGGRPKKKDHLAKNLMSPGDGEYSPELPIPESVKVFVASWLEHKSGSGNLEQIHPKPLVVRHSPEALERLENHFDAIHERLHDERGTFAGQIWARASEKTSKFALLAAISRGSQQIELMDADWAVALTNALTRRMVALCMRHVAENPFEAKALEILRRISDQGRPIEHSTLLRHSKVRSRDFREMLQWLMETGQVVLAVRNTDGRPATGYAVSAESVSERSGWKVVTSADIANAKSKT